MHNIQNITKKIKLQKRGAGKLATLGAAAATLVASGDSGNVPKIGENNNGPMLYLDHRAIKTGKEFSINTEWAGIARDVNLAQMDNGNFVAVWGYNFGEAIADIEGQIFRADGSRVGGEFIITNQNLELQFHPDVTALEGGGFVVAWVVLPAAGVEQYHVKAKIYDVNGVQVGQEFILAADDGLFRSNPEVSGLKNGGFVATWRDRPDEGDAKVIVQAYDAQGNKVGEQFVSDNYAGSDPEITSLEEGGYVAVWVIYTDIVGGASAHILGRIFGINGLAADVGFTFLVNATGIGQQTNPAVASLKDGGFVVVWETTDGVDDPDKGIKAQLFGSTGNHVGEEFLINTETEHDQLNAAVIGTDDGGFIVTWETDPGDYMGYVTGQKFSASGQKIDDEFLVSNILLGDQTSSAIEDLGEGSFVAAWQNSFPFDVVGVDAEDVRAVKGQVFTQAPVFKGEMNGTHNFNIIARPIEGDDDAVLGRLNIFDKPNYMELSSGSRIGDVYQILTWNLDGLQVSFTNDFSGAINIIMEVTSTATDGRELTTRTPVEISVGNRISGDANANIFNATGSTDHVYGEAGRDALNFNGTKAEFSFEMVGDDIRVTQIGTDNADLIHSVEVLNFSNGVSVQVEDLAQLNDIAGVSEADYADWLTYSYEFSPVV